MLCLMTLLQLRDSSMVVLAFGVRVVTMVMVALVTLVAISVNLLVVISQSAQNLQIS